MARKSRDLYTNKRAILGPRSKLKDVDLTSYFAHPLAWDTLTENQKQHLRERLPPYVTYDEEGRPSQEFLKYDLNWKSDVRHFQEDLADGKHEEEWLLEAKQAMDERAEGKYDEWKLQKFEEYWGQKMEVDGHENNGVLTDIQVPDLIAHGSFQVGDVWKYSRVFGRGRNAVLIEYEAKILEVDDYGKLKFQIGGPAAATSTEKRSHDEAFPDDKQVVTSNKTEDLPKQPKLEQSDAVTSSTSQATIEDNEARPYNTRRRRTAPLKPEPITLAKTKPQPKLPLTVATASPKELERKIITTDGRHKWDWKGDSWKYFWCKRGDQELGLLSKIREEYWLIVKGKDSANG